MRRKPRLKETRSIHGMDGEGRAWWASDHTRAMKRRECNPQDQDRKRGRGSGMRKGTEAGNSCEGGADEIARNDDGTDQQNKDESAGPGSDARRVK